MSASSALRARAAHVLVDVAGNGRTLEVALAAAGGPSADRPALQALCYGAVRRFWRHDACLRLMLGKRYGSTDALLRALLIVGLEQLGDARTPPHAAVMETVEATRALGLGRAAGFVNALLRRALRERDALAVELDRDVATRCAFPDWLATSILGDWPAAGDRILAASNEQPPLWLRVNRRRIDPDDYRRELDAQGVGHRGAAFAPEAVRLDVPVDVQQIPGFAAGLVSVQDPAAQLAARLVAPRAGMRILDACAAPGGKACHLLELEPGIELVTVDRDAGRVQRIDQNLVRLGLAAENRVADVAEPGSWWDGRPFDRILLDAPCSGTGVIRRHPDIKLLRRPDDIDRFVATQRRLLAATVKLLRPGGRLVYATCSILRAENRRLIEGFLADTPGLVDVTGSARLEIVALPQGPEDAPGYALLPGAADTDGFFYACLELR